MFLITGILLGILVLFLVGTVLIKPKMKKQNFKYLYAFSGGFLIILATMGSFKEAYEAILEKGEMTPNSFSNIFIMISLLMGGFVVALAMIWMIKRILNPNKKQTASLIKHKWVGLLLIIMHRIPASISLGMIIIEPHINIALLVVFGLHLIPELIIVYYRQIDMEYAKGKAFKNTLYMQFIFVAITLLGAIMGHLIETIWELQAILFTFAGVTMLYATVVEFIPEFIGYINPHHHSPSHCAKYDGKVVVKNIEHNHQIVEVSKELKKQIILVSTLFLIGIIVALTILLFHN